MDNTDIILDLMIELDYNDMIVFKNSSKKFRDLYKSNEDYIYKKKTLALHPCMNSSEDIFLLCMYSLKESYSKKDALYKICLKNDKVLEDTPIDCDLLKNYLMEQIDVSRNLTNSNDRILVILKIYNAVRKCRDTAPLLYRQAFLDVIINKYNYMKEEAISSPSVSPSILSAWNRLRRAWMDELMNDLIIRRAEIAAQE